MADRQVSLKTQRFQKPFGDTFLRAEVDFHLTTSAFGGCPRAEAAIAVVKALWPTAQNVELTATPHPEATERGFNMAGEESADKWLIRGTVTYRG
jgi:hypothetical protein